MTRLPDFCPCCAGKQVVGSNCLATRFPTVAAEWHPTKNGPLTPRDVSFASGKRYWWRCSKKGHEWHAPICYRTSGGWGCPVCKESKGEKAVAKALEGMGLLFKRQARFKSCKLKQILRFDFLVKLDAKLGFLIEYQGQQHYEVVRWGPKMSYEWARRQFCATQIRDRVKAQWAAKRNIPLLVIPYWEFEDIDAVVERFVEDLRERASAATAA
jgi:hypothetical protein